jgi:hypothetical protein
MKNVPVPGYDVTNQVFRTFIDTISLATISFFDFQPTSEAIRQIVAKKSGKSFKSLPADVTADSDPVLFELY